MATALLPNKLLTLSKENKKSADKLENSDFGQKIGLVAKLFGCWHLNISRPFTNGKVSYRSCLQCGAIKRFNPETLETHGSFYYPPSQEKRRATIKEIFN